MRHLPQSEQIKAAAGQFEAIILRQLLQDSMSKLAGDEKSGGGMYSYMMTDVFANKLTEGGGMGGESEGASGTEASAALTPALPRPRFARVGVVCKGNIALAR